MFRASSGNSHRGLVSCLRPQQPVVQESHLRRAQVAPCGGEGHSVRLGPVPQVVLTTPHRCCLHTDVKTSILQDTVSVCANAKKNACRSLNPVVEPLLLFCNHDALHSEIETGTVSPASKSGMLVISTDAAGLVLNL